MVTKIYGVLYNNVTHSLVCPDALVEGQGEIATLYSLPLNATIIMTIAFPRATY
jgi:hypothetical protein